MDAGDADVSNGARFRTSAAAVPEAPSLRSLLADDGEEDEEDEPPSYRGMGLHEPSMALASRYPDAALPQKIGKEPITTAKHVVTVPSFEPPMVHKVPSAGKRDRAALRVEVESDIKEERRQRQQLLQTFHKNEITLVRLKAHNRELMRQVALLKSAVRLPHVGSW